MRGALACWLTITKFTSVLALVSTYLDNVSLQSESLLLSELLEDVREHSDTEVRVGLVIVEVWTICSNQFLHFVSDVFRDSPFSELYFSLLTETLDCVAAIGLEFAGTLDRLFIGNTEYDAGKEADLLHIVLFNESGPELPYEISLLCRFYHLIYNYITD